MYIFNLWTAVTTCPLKSMFISFVTGASIVVVQAPSAAERAPFLLLLAPLPSPSANCLFRLITFRSHIFLSAIPYISYRPSCLFDCWRIEALEDGTRTTGSLAYSTVHADI